MFFEMRDDKTRVINADKFEGEKYQGNLAQRYFYSSSATESGNVAIINLTRNFMPN